MSGLEKTHVIKTPRRAQGPPHDPLPGGYGDEALCGFVRPDGQICGLFVDDHRLVIRQPTYAGLQKAAEVQDGTAGEVVLDDRTFGHWCQPSGFKLGDRQPCLYCGVPLVKIGADWFYDDADQVALAWT